MSEKGITTAACIEQSINEKHVLGNRHDMNLTQKYKHLRFLLVGFMLRKLQ